MYAHFQYRGQMSAEHVDSAVDARRRDPRPGEEMVVVVATSGDLDSVVDDIRALDPGVEVKKILPYNTLRVVVPETVLDDLCSLTGIESVETEGHLRPHESGN